MELFIELLLVVTSLVGLTFIIERGFALRWLKIIPNAVREAVESCRTTEDLPMLKRICEQNPSPVSRLLLVAQEHLDYSREENATALQTTARHEISRLENGLVILEIVVGVAPLLGLVGTISGLITMFSSMGVDGTDSAKFAQGVGVALYATFLGLITAIPSLVAWNYYNRKIDSLGIEMERLCDQFLRRQYRQEPRAEPAVEALPAPAPQTPQKTKTAKPKAFPRPKRWFIPLKKLMPRTHPRWFHSTRCGSRTRAPALGGTQQVSFSSATMDGSRSERASARRSAGNGTRIWEVPMSNHMAGLLSIEPPCRSCALSS
jgi:biopolymer transport protein ExbB